MKKTLYTNKMEKLNLSETKEEVIYVGKLLQENGTGKSTTAIHLAKIWCKLTDIQSQPKRYITNNNSDVRNKMEKLNLSGKETKEDIIYFDEYLTMNGEWRKAHINSLHNGIFKELDYGSSEYTYYVREYIEGDHTIYRCKKNA